MRTQPVARANQGVARGGVDEAELLEIPEVEDQVEARPGRVPGRRHAQGFKSLRLHLAGDAHRRMLATKGLTDAIVVGVDEDGLLEILVVVGRHRLRVEAMQLRDEREDEVASHE